MVDADTEKTPERAGGDGRTDVVGAGILFACPERPAGETVETLRERGFEVEWSDSLPAQSATVGGDSASLLIVDEALLAARDGEVDALAGGAETACILRVGPEATAPANRVYELGLDTYVRRGAGATTVSRLVEQEVRAGPWEGQAGGELGRPDPLIGPSEEMERVRRTIAEAAPSSARVLISGESGVGKELVARAIHRLSPRRRRPFVAVSCGAIPENLIESKLFGHEEGAFTGATSSRAGSFERADTGTLLLDEIGELPSEMQVKLLRVLEEQTFERVGGDERISVDVRVLSATNRDLTVDIEQGSFRRDLFFRLNVLELRVPPLRERPEDIDALWLHFVENAAREEARSQQLETSADVRRKLQRHNWPGNVRELRNVARHAVVLTGAEELRDEDLPERFRSEVARERRENPDRIRVPGMTLEEVERASIIRTQAWTESASETAEVLDISERKVYYKLKEFREGGYLGDREHFGEEGAEVESTGDQPRLIVAEDDRQLQGALGELLEPDYELTTVSTGRELVEEVRDRRPDVILSDIRMPGLDGIQVLRESQSRNWGVPIVLITAHSGEENRQQADLLGASALIEKPVDPEALRSALRNALGAPAGED